MTRSSTDDPLRPAAGDAAESLSALTALLWREREILESLLFKLTEQQLILATGDVRWLPAADAEVRRAVEAVQTHELSRAIEVDALSASLEVPDGATLRQVADAAPEPWPAILLDHREALRLLTEEIDNATTANRRLLQTGEAATRDALARMSGTDRADAPSRGGYTSAGTATRAGRAFLLDERA